MKLGFTTLACIDWPQAKVARWAKEWGYQCVEIRALDNKYFSTNLTTPERREIKSAYDEFGIEIACVSASSRFASPDPAERQRNLVSLKRHVDLAADLGAPIVRSFGGVLPAGISLDTAIEYVAENLSKAGEYAEGSGVKIALETHDDFRKGETVARTLKLANKPTLGALWDTHHPYRSGETAEQTYNFLAPYLIHTHVKDAIERKDAPPQLVLLGKGEVPVKEVVQTLKAKGYNGPICVEWEKGWHPEIEEPEVALPQHIAVLKEYLGE
jgi:sugar phosphate isomerase/epimerase